MSLSPQTIVPGPEPRNFIPPEPAALFAARQDRLTELAATSPMADWLGFVGLVAGAQVHTLPRLDGFSHERSGPLDIALLPQLPAWQGALDGLLETLAAAVDGQALIALRKLAALSADDRSALAGRVINGKLGEGDMDQAPLATAALELVATVIASRSSADGFSSLSAACPACGGAAVASVLETHKLNGLRYLYCGSCNSGWHHVRAQCSHCNQSGRVAYQALEEGGLWQAETCDDCHSYLKLFNRSKALSLDPVADDLASVALDLALGEAGYQRLGANPYLLLAAQAA
ncbi:formate dehydrogenase accessory protein FdhE [Azoarcus indigens]|uniref:FdhE protein n=1 Tax=Azoarcus indigens TaxID=29545 RepID=A0A4R6EED4_9RHOO|nr:formate dehydrogenase accessory protein FdhE [Azoarcus indigens]NMG64246.1 formate dehydrogenase accessory protein FdhE [Azoarcus indigens]TDN55839.1 FdhE protein [Azoarcus indigens]